MYLVYTIDYIHQLQTLKKKVKKNGYRLMTNNKTSNKNRKK
jgi:hypothetical protein